MLICQEMLVLPVTEKHGRGARGLKEEPWALVLSSHCLWPTTIQAQAILLGFL